MPAARARVVVGIAALALGAGLLPGPVAAAPASAANGDEQRMASVLPERLSDSRLGTRVSMLVVDAATGREVFGRRPDRPMLPASNMKIVTAMTVLEAMGPDATFETRVVQGPRARKIILVGGADPILSSADLDRLAARTASALAAAGRDDVPILVGFDDSILPEPSLAPGWPADYVPANAALVRGLTMLGLYSTDTAAITAGAFVSDLRSRGIDARLKARQDSAASAAVLAAFDGNTVHEAVLAMLGPSENNIAELLARHVAISQGRQPTWVGMSEAVTTVLARLGTPLAGVAIRDGSGLSRDDRLTPAALVHLLRLATLRDRPQFSALWFDRGLPVAGRTGTLASRFASWPGSCAAGAVAAKTGTLYDTVALSGVTRGADGRLKVFSVMVNDRPQWVDVLSTRAAVDGLAATVRGCW